MKFDNSVACISSESDDHVIMTMIYCIDKNDKEQLQQFEQSLNDAGVNIIPMEQAKEIK